MGLISIQISSSGATKNIARHHPNFHFQLADNYNSVYNPDGKGLSREYIFPYPDASFDFVFLISVFTHLLLNDMDQYFSEISRVLKPGGNTFITFFLLNDASRQRIAHDSGVLKFKHEYEGCRVISVDAPESAIACREEQVLALYRKYGLEIAGPVHYGSWPTKQKGSYFQDIVIAYRHQEARHD